MKAVVLLSGGIDSAVVAALLKEAGHELHALCFDYGQRHWKELECAGYQAETFCASRRQVELHLPWVRSGLLKEGGETPGEWGVSPHYVPGRNTLFLAYGLSFAESLGAEGVAIGCNVDDRSGFPDCSEGYLGQMRGAFALATKGRVQMSAPLANWTKRRVLEEALRLGVNLWRTWSCYGNGERPCGVCGACKTRAEAFAAVGVADPLLRTCCVACGG